MTTEAAPSSASAVLDAYRLRIAQLQGEIGRAQTRQRTMRMLMLAGGVGSVLIFRAGMHGNAYLIALAAGLMVALAWALGHYFRMRGAALQLAHRAAYCERGINRIEGKWRGQSSIGAEFSRPSHLYQADLDILGEGSLFELLATTRSEVGAERLASFLLDAVEVDEARRRQAAVRELSPATGLREDVALLGKYRFQNCEGKHLRDWLDMVPFSVPRIISVFLLFSGTVSLVLGVCGDAKIFTWVQVFPFLAATLSAQALIGLSLMGEVRERLKVLLTLGADVVVLRQGVALIERQQFHSAKLGDLVQRLRTGNAAGCIRKLERLLTVVERREDVYLYALCLWLAVGTQLVLATERWRAAHRKDFELWLDAWAEFEALNAIGCYAYEHPENVFPELVGGEALFESGAACYEAEELRHPLLLRDACVSNDLVFDRETAFYVISGSNMAGKSTFLRAVGLNAVLAAAGAPVCAMQARMSVFNICTSISIADSLAEGKSKFLAEVERLRAAIGLAQESKLNQHPGANGSRPVLFLIDEILSGTNSRDRRVAAQAVIAALVAAGAVGALSTHDLALTEIAADPALRGVNVHMQSEDPEQPLAFDYRLKSGILRQTNALAIVKMLGIAIDPALGQPDTPKNSA